MCRFFLIFITLAVGGTLPAVFAEELTEIEVAARLLDSTVTIRISAANEQVPENNTPNVLADGVTVCSGVSLSQGLVLTFGRLPEAGSVVTPDDRFRVTLPDGEQQAARPVVIDRYSGLVLLEIDRRDLPGLQVAAALPKIGGTVLTAAAAGIEKPLVSRGVLSGVDRTIAGVDLPPMIQCDISTTAASSGAAVVGKNAMLLGIIAATSTPGENFGWSFAIPLDYIDRVLKARAKDRLVVLVRRRPTVGLKLGSGATQGTVQVERVTLGGPAHKAGIRAGDVVQQADGRKIRSAYQAVALILRRQPGERFSFVVERDGKEKKIEVTLGGSSAIVTDTPGGESHQAQQQVQVGPQLNLRLTDGNRVQVRGRAGVAELSVDGEPALQRSPGNELENLQRQLELYENALEAMQSDRRRREAKEIENEKLLKTLRTEVNELKRQLNAANATPHPASQP